MKKVLLEALIRNWEFGKAKSLPRFKLSYRYAGAAVRAVRLPVSWFRKLKLVNRYYLPES